MAQIQKIDSSTLTVGTDAELPLFLPNGIPFPVTGLVGGTKRDPRPVKGLPQGFALQEDNVNLEFNIRPASTPQEFNKNIVMILKAIKQELPPTVSYKVASATEYLPDFLDHPAALRFGCDPDFNVYTGSENPRPRSTNPNLRTAAAHIHVGWGTPTNEQRRSMVKKLDFTIGLAYCRKSSKVRKEMYGKAGSYRPKEYGVEYRTPGNEWLTGSGPEAVFNLVRLAVDLHNSGFEATVEEENTVQECINTCSVNDRLLRFADKVGVYIL